MNIWPSLSGAVVLGANAHAALALVLGLRAHDAPTIARHARRCAWSAVGLALLAGVALATSIRANAPGGDSPAERATRLAMLISELMNCAAFTVLVVLLPLIAAAVLRRRARQAGARR